MAAGFRVLTVTQLCRFAKSLLEEQKVLEDVLVRGEISNLSYRQASGHLYFSLRDGGALVRCVMFRRYLQNLRELPEDGMSAVVRGAATLYERDGSFEIIVYDLQPMGAGQGRQGLEALKHRLQEEGLFREDRKRPLPEFPAAIGVVTSRDGAALQDLIRTLRRRGYGGKLILYPCLVQGDAAPASILQALAALEAEGLCQSAVIARGGGSSEDLSAFNDEAVVRAACRCPVPLVSAVGHEVDYTLLDLAADARAATPTAAGELLVPDRETVAQRVHKLQSAAVLLARQGVQRKRMRLLQDMRLLSARSPRERVERNRQKLEYLVRLLVDAQKRRLQALRGQVCHLLRQLELVNPAAVMRKGYSVALLDGKAVSSVEGLSPGREMTTLLADGQVVSVIRRCCRKGEERGEEADPGRVPPAAGGHRGAAGGGRNQPG